MKPEIITKDKEVPEAKYAVFTHKGPADRIKETYDYIYGIWAQKSGYTLSKDYDFVKYDNKFNLENPQNSEVSIYIPIS